MTTTERNNIDAALLTQKQVLRQELDAAGNTVYVVYQLQPLKYLLQSQVAAFGTSWSTTITP